MALEIVWSPRSERNLDSIIEYLKTDWTEREAANFIKQVSKITNLVSESPLLFRALTGEHNVREAVITKHNLLIYRVHSDRIEILAVFDTRQNPKKKASR